VSCTYQVGRSCCDCRPFGSSSHECKQTRIRFPCSLYLSGDRPRCLILALYASETGGAGQVLEHAEFLFHVPNFFSVFSYKPEISFRTAMICYSSGAAYVTFLFLHTTFLCLFIFCFLVYLSPVSARRTRFTVGVINDFGWHPLSSTWVIYRVIHKSLRNFRTRLRNNQERQGRKEHINR